MRYFLICYMYFYGNIPNVNSVDKQSFPFPHVGSLLGFPTFGVPFLGNHIYIYILYIYIPIGSMYAIYGNIYHQYTPNVSIYTIHGSYGIWWGSLICTAVYPKLLCVLKTKFDFPLGVGIRNPSCTSGTHVCQYPNLKPHPWFEHTLQSKLKIQTYLRWESTGAYPNVNNWKSFSRIWHL